jgi:predicted enzyme related to lactoylglutathione lyase
MSPSDAAAPPVHRPTHGQQCFLQIPARDVSQSAAFYGDVFGWVGDEVSPSFVAPSMIGQWVDDRPASIDAGVVVWICVDDIEVTLAAATSRGGHPVDAPYEDGGGRLLATLDDLTGNRIGLVQLGAPTG